jgi:hypothetical protein
MEVFTMENNNIKKYVSPEKLSLYDSKIKEFLATADEATLESAKGYADEKLAEAAAAHKTDVDALDTRVKTVEDDYLTSADKTELSNAIGAETERATGAEEALTQAIAAEKERAEGAESTLSQAIATEKERAEAAEGVLTQAVTTEKERAEAAEGVLTQAIADEKTRAEAAEAGLQTQINTIMNNPDAEGAINSINEFTQYVAEHGTIAEGMRIDINKNKDDIAAEASRAATAEEAIAGRVKNLEDNKAGYATTTEVAAAKQEAIDAAKTESTNGDVVVLAEAQKYADAKVAEAQAAIDAFVEVTEDEILALFN